MTAGGNHRLNYEQTPEGGLRAVCSCDDFRVWIETYDDSAEMALLTFHQVHLDHPELGRPR